MICLPTRKRSLQAFPLLLILVLLAPAVFGAERMVTVTNDGAGFFLTDTSRQWVPSTCVNQLRQSGVDIPFEQWSEVGPLPRATVNLTCNQIQSRLANWVAAAVSDNGDGFLLLPDGTRQWLSWSCVTQLENAGLSLTRTPWAQVVPRPVSQTFRSCDVVEQRLLSQGGSSGSDLTVAILSTDGDGFLLLPDNTRQWLPPACITQLRNASVPMTSRRWDQISGRAITQSPLSCNAIEARMTGDGGGDPNIDPSQVTCSSSDADIKAAALQVINASRSRNQQCGSDSFARAGSLQWDSRLALAATRHSQDMAGNDFFSHTGSDGLGVGSRARSAGYPYSYVGENIAAGYSNMRVVHDGLMDSDGHCRNIMNSRYIHVGAACIANPNSRYRSYWTFVFGLSR